MCTVNKVVLMIISGSILASAAAIAELQVTFAIVSLVIGTCLAGAEAIAQFLKNHLWPGKSQPSGPHDRVILHSARSPQEGL